ncbi:beta-propeller fold lactonase family protein [Streptomyces sp. NPDC046821]|uniref:beta-propeller fold lactonase family protein n=1 Tax=Streptomyces sp. NPDC046821 TaxID=3154702 RepID=UPI0033FEEFE8
MRWTGLLNGRKRRSRKSVTAAVCAGALVMGGGLAFALDEFQHAGPQGDGTAYTPAGWRVTPAGAQKAAGFFPANAVLSPDGQSLVVPNIVRNAHGKQTVQVLDAGDGKLVQELELDTSNSSVPQGVAPGLAFSHDGKHAFLATAGKNAVLVLDWDSAARKLSVNKSLPLPKGSYPQTVAVSPDDKTVYASGQYSRALIAVDVASGKTDQAPVDLYPYGVTLSEDGRTAYVSNQGAKTVSVFSVDGLKLTARPAVTVGTHPGAMLLDAKQHRLFVANGDNDTVSVLDSDSNQVTNTISLAPFKGAHGGAQPTNLTLSPDRATLYVTNGGNNDVAVVNVSDRGEFGQVKGLIPTGWYPTGVQVSPDGKRLLVTSAKGLGTGPNKGSDASNPDSHPYIENQLQGYLSVVPVPDAGQLAKYTRQVRENNGFDAKNDVRGFDGKTPGTIVPRRVGDSSPIKHVIYVVKENRTYDQVLGDLPKGNGDPSQAIFGKDVTPNHHKLADQFVTLDNFYVNGEVSQNGWQWATQASSNGENETATAQGYAGNGSEYDSEGYHPDVAAAGADPDHAYLWDKLAQQKVPFRNYGQFVVPHDWITQDEKVKCAKDDFCAHDPLLDAQTNHAYPWFDMGVTDQHRYDVWNKDFQGYVAHDNLPKMQFIDLPRDHTAGGATAKQLVADNDLALGKIVDTVSHSKYWKSTAIFVVEDDAQAGPDHVDAHRTIASVISPYTQTGKVDSHFYSQVSMLRTMELFLGVDPMSQYDAAALPMIYSFTDKPDFTPYSTVTPPSVTATVSDPIVKPGQTLTVTGKVTNPGSTPLTGAKVRLTTPDGWKATPDTPSDLGTLAPGADSTLTWKVAVPSGATYGQQRFTVQADYPVNGHMTASQKATVATVVPDPHTAQVPQAFVANYSSNSVSAVDVSTGKLLADIQVGSAPGTIAVSPDHTRAFVANQGSNTVSVIDVAADAVVSTIPVGKTPAGLAVSPDNKTLWVSAYGDNAVQPVDIATGKPGAEIGVGSGPENLALTPDGSTLYVANKWSDTVTPVRTDSRTAGAAIKTGSQPFGIAVTPDGRTAYVTDMGSGDVTPIDLASGAPRDRIKTGATPFNISVSADGKTAYVANTGSDKVTPIDTATGTAEPALTAGSAASGVAVSPDGTTVFATAAGQGTLVPLSTSTGKAGTPIQVGSYPIWVSYAPAVGSQPALRKQALSQTSPAADPSVFPSLAMTPQEMAGSPDQAGSAALNEEIWKAIRGQHSKMPAPQHHIYGNVPGAGD